MLEKSILLLLTLLCAGPCVGYSIYLWRNKRKIAALCNTLPALCAFALAITILISL